MHFVAIALSTLALIIIAFGANVTYHSYLCACFYSGAFTLKNLLVGYLTWFGIFLIAMIFI